MPSSPIPAESFVPVVDVVLRVAQMHSSRLALSDLEQLLPTGSSREDLVNAFQTHPGLAGKYVLKDGFVFSKQTVQSQTPDVMFETRSMTNVQVARWLTIALKTRNDTLVAVSGSTSYKSASKKDDVDLFCVTPRGTMWLFLAKALLFTRLSRLARKSRTPICLSCVMDRGYADDMFSHDRGALFARDALVAEVITGGEVYRHLVSMGRWMLSYFPKLYSLREGAPQQDSRVVAPSLAARLVNWLLFVTLGQYIVMKARFHNTALRRHGNPRATFVARIGIDHLIYESSKYVELQKMYRNITPTKATPDKLTDMELVEQGPALHPR